MKQKVVEILIPKLKKCEHRYEKIPIIYQGSTERHKQMRQ